MKNKNKENKRLKGLRFIFLLVFIVGTLAGIFGYLSSKITTFEECKQAGWLVRSIAIYDGNSLIEEECELWSGKHFVKEQNSSNFGNNQVEKSITDYLLTQKYFSWKTATDGHNFCVIENLNPTESSLFPLYVWVRCGEFVLQNGELKELSGKSVPAKIDYPNQLSFYDLSKFSYEVPGDGAQYIEDIKRIFSEELARNIIHFDKKNINKKIESITLSSLKQ